MMLGLLARENGPVLSIYRKDDREVTEETGRRERTVAEHLSVAASVLTCPVSSSSFNYQNTHDYFIFSETIRKWKTRD